MNIEDILSEQDSIVVVDNVSVSFGKQDVLRNISLSIPPGQTLALLGESGCGKTVLMKSIIGLVQPTLGTVSFDGQNINLMNDRQLSHERLRFGFVFQNAALFDSMTIGQNVAFPLRQHGRFSDQQIREMVLSRLSEVGLPDSVVYKKPAELSGGMRKRVGLARALIMNPELIMYDEPTTGLDPIMSDVINELIIRTRRRNPVTSIVVTHDMNTAHKVADRVVMLMPVTRLEENESQIIFDGTVAELDACRDRRVQQFINGEAGERLMELRGSQSG
ncbi:MAG: phospholipid/cholesterol/gamma-HCH transport system ATP-binding protein [Mariniblastus sp.]|jgi:phospholipid/cholesterol/gamma-HCH transport system ATP-binding protein